MSPSFSTALRLWFKLGGISFGGPIAQIDLMHREVVERRGRDISVPLLVVGAAVIGATCGLIGPSFGLLG